MWRRSPPPENGSIGGAFADDAGGERGRFRDPPAGVRGRRPPEPARSAQRGREGGPRAEAPALADRAGRLRPGASHRRPADRHHAKGEHGTALPLARPALTTRATSARPSMTWPGSTRPRRSSPRSWIPARPGALPAPRGGNSARRPALRPPGYRKDPACARRRGGGPPSLLLAVGGRVRGDGGRWASAACAICSSRRRTRRPRSSSSTSAMPSAGSGVAHRRGRPRRARADPEPDPYGAGRLLRPDAVIVLAATNRAEILDAPAAAGPLRPPDCGRPAGPRGPTADSRRAHSWGAAGPRGGPGGHRRPDPRDGRRGSQEPRERGGAHRGGALVARNLARADFDRAVEKIVLGAERRIAIPSWSGRAPPTTRRATRCSACSSRARIRCGRSRSCRVGRRSARLQIS